METSNDERERLRRQLYLLVYQPGLIPTKIVVFLRACACACLLGVCICFVCLFLFAFGKHGLAPAARTHQVVSMVVAEASTAGGEKLKGRRKSMPGLNKKDETEEMPRVHSPDFSGLNRFCALVYKHKRYCIFDHDLQCTRGKSEGENDESFILQEGFRPCWVFCLVNRRASRGRVQVVIFLERPRGVRKVCVCVWVGGWVGGCSCVCMSFSHSEVHTHEEVCVLPFARTVQQAKEAQPERQEN